MLELLIIAVILWFLFFRPKDRLDLPFEYVNAKPLDDKEKAAFMLYKENYLKSASWVSKRLMVLSRDNHRCSLCSSTDRLNVHHMSGYDKIPHEPLECLVTLCQECHTKEHEKHGYPSTYEDYMNWNKPLQTLTEK